MPNVETCRLRKLTSLCDDHGTGHPVSSCYLAPNCASAHLLTTRRHEPRSCGQGHAPPMPWPGSENPRAVTLWVGGAGGLF